MKARRVPVLLLVAALTALTIFLLALLDGDVLAAASPEWIMKPGTTENNVANKELKKKSAYLKCVFRVEEYEEGESDR